MKFPDKTVTTLLLRDINNQILEICYGRLFDQAQGPDNISFGPHKPGMSAEPAKWCYINKCNLIPAFRLFKNLHEKPPCKIKQDCSYIPPYIIVTPDRLEIVESPGRSITFQIATLNNIEIILNSKNKNKASITTFVFDYNYFMRLFDEWLKFICRGSHE